MNETMQLMYSTVDLFIYDVRDSLGQNSQEINRNRERFWVKIDRQLDNLNYNSTTTHPKGAIDQILYEKRLAELASLENSEADYTLLQSKEFESPLNGYYFPVQLGDTYSLQLNCSGVESKPSINNLRNLKQVIVSALNHHQVKTEIELDKQGNIGQTWFVWGQLAQKNLDVVKIAKECYEQLTPNSQWKQPIFKECGQLLGGTLFEFWHIPNNWGQEWEKFSQENYHLIICLFPAGESIGEITKKVRTIYLDLNRLFCYRHKILWAYWQSQQKKTEIKQGYDSIKNLMNEGKKLLDKFQQKIINLRKLQLILSNSLVMMSNYAIDLNYLEDKYRNIKVNIKNYNNRLQKLEIETDSDLKILSNFSNFAQEKYQQKVENDLANFNPGLQLLHNLNQTIESIIKVEQAKGDRTLITALVSTGTGLAVSNVSAIVLTAQQPPDKDTFFIMTPAFYLSVSNGLLACLIVAILLTGRHR